MRLNEWLKRQDRDPEGWSIIIAIYWLMVIVGGCVLAGWKM